MVMKPRSLNCKKFGLKHWGVEYNWLTLNSNFILILWFHFYFHGYYLSYYVHKKLFFYNTHGNYKNINLNILVTKKIQENPASLQSKRAKNDHELIIYTMII